MLKAGRNDVERVGIRFPDHLWSAEGAQFVGIHGIGGCRSRKSTQSACGRSCAAAAPIAAKSAQFDLFRLQAQKGTDVIDDLTPMHRKGLLVALEVNATIATAAAT